jgi:Protein of unknown function (DUF2628)
MDGDRPERGQINPYAAPAAALPASQDTVPQAHDLTRDEVKSFVGNNHAYYWGSWQRTATKGGLLAGFNGAAFFFNLLWLLYRRMHREFWIGCGAVVAANIGLVILGIVTERNVDRLTRVIDVAVAATVGMLGNGLYLRRARRVIAAARAEEANPERRMHLLTVRGGTSALWPLVGVVVLAVLLAVLAVLRSG